MSLLEKQLANGLIYHPFDLTQSDIASLKVNLASSMNAKCRPTFRSFRSSFPKSGRQGPRREHRRRESRKM